MRKIIFLALVRLELIHVILDHLLSVFVVGCQIEMNKKTITKDTVVKNRAKKIPSTEKELQHCQMC